MMRRIFLLLLLSIFAFALGGTAWAQATPPAPTPPPAPSFTPAFGLGVSLPIITVTGLTTALTFINTWVEAPLTLDIAARLGLRLYLSAAMLRADLTTVDSSLLIFLNRGTARFYIGGGLGAFPYESYAAFGNSYGPGLMLSLHHLTGFRVTTGALSIFAELRYELMPQSICLIDGDADGVYDGICNGNGAFSSFQLTIGGMISFGGPGCIPCCGY